MTETDLPDVDRHAAGAAGRGADFVSTRRPAELLGATTLAAHAETRALLVAHRPDDCEPPCTGRRPR